MTTVTARTRNDLLAVVPRVLGFAPSESIVVMGTGGGLTARLDLTEKVTQLRETLRPAEQNWRAHGPVVVVVYAAEPLSAFFLLNDLESWLPDTPVADAFAVVDGLIVEPDGHIEGPVEPSDVANALPEAAASRDELEARAADCESATEAAALAVDSYREGQGALAWAYIDRARALDPNEFVAAALNVLERLIRDCVDPKSVSWS